MPLLCAGEITMNKKILSLVMAAIMLLSILFSVLTPIFAG